MPSRKYRPQMYTCGKCKHQVSEGAVNDHLAKCQPKGVECGKCKKLILDPDFVGHYKTCKGKQAVEAIAEALDVPVTKG